jgi:hypothetical protein
MPMTPHMASSDTVIMTSACPFRDDRGFCMTIR